MKIGIDIDNVISSFDNELLKEYLLVVNFGKQKIVTGNYKMLFLYL